jgi:hypothetical protein
VHHDRTRPRRATSRTRLRLVVVAQVAAVLVGGCGTTLTPAEMADQCAALAADAQRAGLTATPTGDQVKEAADRLDDRLPELRDPRVHDAAVALHSHLHGVEAALAKGDAVRAAKLVDAARDDVAKAAKACGLPESQFLGG